MLAYKPMVRTKLSSDRAFLARRLTGNERNILQDAFPENIELLPPKSPSSETSSKSKTSSNMAAKDPQKYTLSDVYGIYDYDYVHHPPYGPTSVEVQTEHPNSQVDDVVNMYLNEAKFQSDPGTMEPPTTSRCSCCSDVNSYNAKHRTMEAAVSRHPFVQYPTVPPIATSTPTLFTETIMHPSRNGLRQEVYSSSEPDFRSPSPSLESKLYTKPDILPLSTDDERKMYLTQPQRSRFFNEFGMRDTRHKKRAEEVVSASYKYNVAMEKLNRTVQSMDSDIANGENKKRC